MKECKMYGENDHCGKVNRIKEKYEMMLSLTTKDVEYANKLAFEICKLQKDDGSWKVYEETRIERDCMIGYGYIPTYYGAAALMHLKNMDKQFNYENELNKAFAFITFNGKRKFFPGHGFDAERDQLQALNIFKKAGAYRFLQKYGNEYKTFDDLIKTIIKRYREALASGLTYGGFAEDFREKYEKEVEDYEILSNEEVWYVAYGSNINFNRFQEYINLCGDKTPPIESKKYVLPYDIYFAYSSSRWDRKGVAFLDDSQQGKAYGRAYKIKIDQFYDIMRLEGGIYNKKICLDVLDGIPVYTFTSKQKRNDIKEPSPQYVDVIMRGLIETYTDKSSLALEMYLYDKCILNDIDRAVLGYIRNSEHGVALENIAISVAEGGITKTRQAIKKLVLHGLVKQDSLNIRQGHTIDSREAVFYTVKEKRNLIDLLTI